MPLLSLQSEQHRVPRPELESVGGVGNQANRRCRWASAAPATGRSVYRAILRPADSCGEVSLSLPESHVSTLPIPLYYKSTPLFLRVGPSHTGSCLPWEPGQPLNRRHLCLQHPTGVQTKTEPCLSVTRRIAGFHLSCTSRRSTGRHNQQHAVDLLTASQRPRASRPRGRGSSRLRTRSRVRRRSCDDEAEARLLRLLPHCTQREISYRLSAAGTVDFLAPILSNENRKSCSRTMLSFFDWIHKGSRPEVALFETRKQLWDFYGGDHYARRLWRAFPFRLYKLN